MNELELIFDEVAPDTVPKGAVVDLIEVCFGAHPGGGDYRTYVLEKSLAKKVWKLWLKVYVEEWQGDENDEPGDWLYGLQAIAKCSEQESEHQIARHLLTACWIEELKLYGTSFENVEIEKTGILDASDVADILRALP